MNYEQIFSDPMVMMGLQMMAANQGRGMAPAAAFGRAGVATASNLAATRERASQRAREDKMIDIQEARNTEQARHNRATEGTAQDRLDLYSATPVDLGGGKYFTPLHGVQGGSMDPITAMLMSQMGLPGMGMGGGMPSPGGSIDDQLRSLDDSFKAPAAPAAKPAPAAPAPAPAMPTPVVTPAAAPVMTAGASGDDVLDFTLRDLLEANQSAGQAITQPVMNWWDEMMANRRSSVPPRMR